MKPYIKLFCLFMIYMATGCKYFKSDHPQADLPQSTNTGMNEQAIDAFTKNLDQSAGSMNKTHSLVYDTGDGSLYVERYANTNGDQLYIEHLNSDIINTIKKYYSKKDSLILVLVNNIQNTDKGKVFKDSKTYLRNFVVFKRSARTASSAQAVQILPYLNVQNDNERFVEDYHDDLASMNDALNQRNKFEMVFDNVTTYPDATFVMLKSKARNGVKASVQLLNKDQYIDSLLNFPGIFKDQKLRLKWKIEDKQAVYVPDGSTSTSASGLNK